MAVTLRDVAIASGLSKPTVARVLRDPSAPFRAETRQRVLRMAKQLGYRPNAAARAINDGRFGNVVLVLGTDPGRSHLINGLIEGIDAELMSRDMSLMVAQLPDEQLTSEGFVPRVLSQNMADGMMINYGWGIPEAMLELIRQNETPTVWLNTKLPSDCVHPDDFGAGRTAVEHLHRLRHQRIMYIHLGEHVNTDRHYSWNDRHEGYVQGMIDAGLSPRACNKCVPIEQQRQVIRTVLLEKDRPTAIVAVNDSVAVQVIFEAMLLGLRVPEDLSVFGIVSRWKPFVAGMYIESLMVPGREVGEAAVQMLMSRIAKPLEPLPTRAIPMIAMEGGTCAHVGV